MLGPSWSQRGQLTDVCHPPIQDNMYFQLLTWPVFSRTKVWSRLTPRLWSVLMRWVPHPQCKHNNSPNHKAGVKPSLLPSSVDTLASQPPDKHIIQLASLIPSNSLRVYNVACNLSIIERKPIMQSHFMEEAIPLRSAKKPTSEIIRAVKSAAAISVPLGKVNAGCHSRS